ncbi:MAG: MerR family transcriptional regulator, partial [Solirubrobacteraceae bacterium]
LLGRCAERAAGAHRAYTESDVERLAHVLRLKELLGVSLDDLRTLVEAEDGRAALRAEFHAIGEEAALRRREILEEGRELLDRQLALVRGRRQELDRLAGELEARRARVEDRLRDLRA